MAGRPRGRNSRYHYVNPRNDHDDRVSRPSTSRGGGGYSDRHNFNKKVTFKANQRGGNNNFRKSWDSKTDLVREQLDGEFSSRNGQSRNNSGRRSFPDRNYNRGGGHGNFRNPSWTLKESSTGWYCILVPNIEDGDEVMKIIQTYITPIVFYPYNKQYFENALRFLVDDFKVARTLHNTSYKITLRDDRKLIIRVNPYLPPRGPISFTPVLSDVREKMIEAMATRYNPSTKSLDLSRFYGCSLFTENQLFVPLNRPAVLLAALNMVAQHTKNDLYGLSLENNHIYLGEGLVWIRRLFPDLKVLDLAGNKFSDLKELKSLSGFTIEVLNLSRNPVCDTEDKERYRRDVQQLFPILQKLDNSELPSRYSAMAGNKLKIPINQSNSYPLPEGVNPDQPNPVKTLVESFLSEFYERYDNKVSRQLVADAYHESATFSISSCFLCNISKGTLSQYMSFSRNTLKYIKNNKTIDRSRYMYRGRENIINILEKLPKTKHDLVSFQVDVPLVNRAMVQIVVNGVFAEEFKETNARNVFRSFSRTFCIVPIGNGWSIMNDMLFITVVSDEMLLESSKRFFVLRPQRVSTKKNNFNGNNNNVTMFMEDTEEMSGMESSTYQQSDTPNYPPPPYQEQPSFSSYQMSAPINPQQTSLYQGSSQTPIMQNQQMTFQQQNHSAVTSVSPVAPPPPYQLCLEQSNTSFLTPAQVPVNQPPIENHLNSIGDANTNLAMIKSFSNESGMNYKWAEKCLQDNNWDYTKAALCFAKLKPNIPSDAFTINTN